MRKESTVKYQAGAGGDSGITVTEQVDQAS